MAAAGAAAGGTAFGLELSLTDDAEEEDEVITFGLKMTLAGEVSPFKGTTGGRFRAASCPFGVPTFIGTESSSSMATELAVLTNKHKPEDKSCWTASEKQWTMGASGHDVPARSAPSSRLAAMCSVGMGSV